MNADLHTHTTDSDGKLEAFDLFKLAKEKNLDIVAITDHDICKNFKQKKALAKEVGITYLPGIELSTLYHNKSVHLLGYFKDESYKSKTMKDYYVFIKKAREKRAKQFIKNLKRLHDINIDYDRLVELSNGIIARPHIAQAILEKYDHLSRDEIFDHMIGDHTEAYVPSSELSLAEGIKFLKNQNCLVILAHPKLLSQSIHDAVLKHDFDGIEAIYGLNDESENAYYKKIANQNDWLITAGSDFHGIINDTKHKMLGDVRLEGEALKRFLNALNQ